MHAFFSRIKSYIYILYYNNMCYTCVQMRVWCDLFTDIRGVVVCAQIYEASAIFFQIYEVGMVVDRRIATVYSAIPAITVTSETTDAELDSLEFATEQKKMYPHEAVGSGTPGSLAVFNSGSSTLVASNRQGQHSHKLIWSCALHSENKQWIRCVSIATHRILFCDDWNVFFIMFCVLNPTHNMWSLCNRNFVVMKIIFNISWWLNCVYRDLSIYSCYSWC